MLICSGTFGVTVLHLGERLLGSLYTMELLLETLEVYITIDDEEIQYPKTQQEAIANPKLHRVDLRFDLLDMRMEYLDIKILYQEKHFVQRSTLQPEKPLPQKSISFPFMMESSRFLDVTKVTSALQILQHRDPVEVLN